MSTMMECGHAAQGTDANGGPVCVICVGINPGARTPAISPPDLTGRVARCAQCGTTAPSSPNLAFFRHNPDAAEDDFYSGCRGWD